MKYELSPYPPFLFEGKNILRKPDKAPLLHAVRSHVNSSNDAILQVIPKTDHYVLDVLIHRLKWTDGSTYNSIADAYASFTVDVIFDGYYGGPSTKDNAHQRRRLTKVTNKVDISDATKFVGKKDDFSLEWYEQTCTHQTNLRTFAREGMSYHPGRRRCRLSSEKTLTCWSCCSIMHQRTTGSTCTFGQTRVHQMYIT